MSSSSVSFSPASPSERFTGRVKWFNNKAGYGFVTITDGSQASKDVFVHHSAVKVDSEQYKYLVQGEYIEFCLSDTKGVGDHEYQAGDVSGINGGKLMCETRRESRTLRVQHTTSDAEPVRMPRSREPPTSGRGRGSGASGRGVGASGRGSGGRGRGEKTEPNWGLGGRGGRGHWQQQS